MVRQSGRQCDDEPSVEHENRSTESYCADDEDVITGEVRPAVKNLITNKMSTFIKESLDDILRKSLQNAGNGI